MHYLGVDMAVDKHDLCLMADDGRVLSECSVSNSHEGFEDLRRLLNGLGEIVINVERPDGMFVDWLSKERYGIYVTPPLLVAHRRGRRTKDDRGDAYLLAQLLQIKDRDCRPLPRQSQVVLHLDQLIKAYDIVVEEQHRDVVRLIWTLRQYYPTAVDAFRDRDSPTFLAFLKAYPTPRAAQALSMRKLAQFLRKHKAFTTSRLNKIYAALQAPLPPVPLEEGYVEAILMILPRIQLLSQQHKQLHQRIVEVFETHPEARWWRSFPGASGPLTPARLLAAIGDDRQRYPSAQVLQAIAGTVPVTRRSGKQIRIEFRRGCSKLLRRAVGDLARQSIKHSGWARSYFYDQLERGHHKSRAYRALGNRWLAIIWKLWQTGDTYCEAKHVANRSRRGQPVSVEDARQVASA
jgi:transposase